jgi:hypothetical protein
LGKKFFQSGDYPRPPVFAQPRSYRVASRPEFAHQRRLLLRASFPLEYNRVGSRYEAVPQLPEAGFGKSNERACCLTFESVIRGSELPFEDVQPDSLDFTNERLDFPCPRSATTA